MTHQTLLSFRIPGVPVFEVVVAALSWSRVREIKGDYDEATLARLFPLIELTDKNELLRCRV